MLRPPDPPISRPPASLLGHRRGQMVELELWTFLYEHITMDFRNSQTNGVCNLWKLHAKPAPDTDLG